MIIQTKNKIYLILCFITFVSCSIQRRDNCVMGEKEGIVSAEYKNEIIKSIDKNMSIVLDSISKINLFKNQFVSLSYTNNDKWIITISQKIELVDILDLFIKTRNYVLFSNKVHIFISPCDTNIFNRFFL
jgi:hypothetical protein